MRVLGPLAATSALLLLVSTGPAGAAAAPAATPVTAAASAAAPTSVDAATASSPFAAVVPTRTGAGLWLVDRSGGFTAVGDATVSGGFGRLNTPIVAATANATGGFWAVGEDGGVFSQPGGSYLGGLGDVALNQPVRAAAATPSGQGYWLVAADGGVFTFGDAPFLGSLGDIVLNQPIVTALATPSGQGYWLVAADGGVFTFGDAPFLGSLGSVRLNAPIVGAAARAGGLPGYWLVAADGGVFTFGDAPFLGSAAGDAGQVVAMAARPTGDGYWLLERSGEVHAFGGATQVDTPIPVPPLGDVVLTTEVVVSGLSSPTAVAVRPGDRAVYVTERGGRVRVLRGDAVRAAPVLELPPSLLSQGGERGLLGLAFSLDGSHLYVHHTLSDGDVVVAEYRMSGPSGSEVATDRRELLRIEHSTYANHNGGDLQVARDGTLFITVGDGGGAGDPLGAAQDTDRLLGKVLRIDPAAPTAGRPYGIPVTNPFADGVDGAPEVWAWGLRNPWRISFDRATGDLWIADVGQDGREEVNLERAAGRMGGNYGWPWFEGDLPYRLGAGPTGVIGPVFTYPHADGDGSITGGRVYRGTRIPALAGAYLYADFLSGRVGALRAELGSASLESARRLLSLPGVVSFGEDPDGELLVVQLNGTIRRIVPA